MWHRGKELNPGFDTWVKKILWNRKWQLTPVFLPGKFRGKGSLANYSLWGRKELNMIELTHIKIVQGSFSNRGPGTLRGIRT